MNIFRRPHYESEITQFIHQMKTEKPNLESRQLAGRALLWDKNVDRSAMAEYQEARVAQRPYVYYDNDNARYMQEHKRPEPAAHQTLMDTPSEAGALESSVDELTAMPQVIDQVALARLYGEPLFALPQDLYIPPDALEVFLEAFEGPLDLLLYLIRRQNFNILDIPMAGLTRQYLAYVDEIRGRNLELAAEYLLMAAMLIEIKSRMLLPPKKVAEGQEPEDPRAELVRRLLEYEQMKLAAARLNAMPQFGRDFLKAEVYIEQALQPRFPDVNVVDLQEAWRDIMKRARLVQRHKISREELSVREHMSIVLRQLQGRRFMEFENLFDPAKGTPVLVVTFIALLELAKEMLIEVTQAEAFAPIYVRLAYSPT